MRSGHMLPTFTQIVFDLKGQGFPTMIVQKPDSLHVSVTFKDATGDGLILGGLRSIQVRGLAPAQQRGSDLFVLIDLARPVRVDAYTLPSEPGYYNRLVLDLYSS
jgi:hypothetical protein